MKTNKTLLFLCFALGFILIVQGQSKGDFEQIKTLKVAYFTEHLHLTPEEAQKFWPIYNKHETVQLEMYTYMKKNMNPRILKAAQYSETEAAQKLAEFLDKKSKEGVSMQKMYAALQGVLPANKTLALVHVEEGFRRHLMSLYRKNRANSKKEK